MGYDKQYNSNKKELGSIRGLSSKDESHINVENDDLSDFSGGDPGEYEDIKNKKIMGAISLSNHKSLRTSPTKQ